DTTTHHPQNVNASHRRHYATPQSARPVAPTTRQHPPHRAMERAAYGQHMQELQDQGQSNSETGRGQTDPTADDTDSGAETRAVMFVCATCGAPVTGPVTRLPAVPEAPYYAWWDADVPGPSPATVPSGHYAIETEPYGAPLVATDIHGPVMPRHGSHYNADGKPLMSLGPRGNIVVNPDDARGLSLRHVSAACCGATPYGGMNQLCVCGTLVATLSSDCCLPYELHLSATQVHAVHV
ncbi:hypothetical protein ACFW1A_27470, partial [Kitasatospora sp. NPDC058965]|uniref:hypothetical protein n=1 Tax=Kitasatospora sp. NPDC058965 TaxID=3346682 RepID=UPI0036934D18